MAISFHGVSLLATGGPQAWVPATLPGGAVIGDLLIFHAAILAPAEMNASFFFPPNGWTQLVMNPSVALVQEFVFYAFYTDPSFLNQLWKLGFVVQITAHILAYSGVSSTIPFGTVQQAAQLGYERLSAPCARSAGFRATKTGNVCLCLYSTQRISPAFPSVLGLTMRASNEYVPNIYAGDTTISSTTVAGHPLALVPNDTWATSTIELIAA